jgi:hypothetical protein
MANALYATGKEAILNGDIDFNTDTIKAALVSNAYAQNLTTDDFYSDISAAVIGTPQTITSPTITLGVFDGDDVTFTAVGAGSTLEAVVIYKDTGNPATSQLIAYVDTITGFPLATNGGDITIQWSSGANKILSL